MTPAVFAELVTDRLGSAIHEARRRRGQAQWRASQCADAARVHQLAGIDASWHSAVVALERYLAHDPGYPEGVTIDTFDAVCRG